MAKFLGTGKDPRAPEGVDFDIPDVREHEVRAVIDGGIGEPLAADELDRLHTAEQIIKAEGGDPQALATSTATVASSANRAAARVETTSPGADLVSEEDDPSGRHGEPGEVGSGQGEEDGDDLDGLKRAELDERAHRAGVEDPEDLPNKEAVADAIRKAEGGESASG